MAKCNPKLQVRDLVRVVGIVALMSHGVSGRYPGKIRFIEPQGVNGHRKPVSGVPNSGTPRENQANFRDGTVSKFRDGTLWGL